MDSRWRPGPASTAAWPWSADSSSAWTSHKRPAGSAGGRRRDVGARGDGVDSRPV